MNNQDIKNFVNNNDMDCTYSKLMLVCGILNEIQDKLCNNNDIRLKFSRDIEVAINNYEPNDDIYREYILIIEKWISSHSCNCRR